MHRAAWYTIVFLFLLPITALAGPVEDANAVLDRWSAAYTSNDPEAVTNSYWPDAILLGTVSPVISEGHDAILKYFSVVKGTGNNNAIQERHTINRRQCRPGHRVLRIHPDAGWEAGSRTIAVYDAHHQAWQRMAHHAPPLVTARATEVNQMGGCSTPERSRDPANHVG